MIKEIIAQGKDISEAKENARLALGVDEFADVRYEVIHAGSRGIFGIIGVKQAQVKASIEIPDAAPRRERKGNREHTDAERPQQHRRNDSPDSRVQKQRREEVQRPKQQKQRPAQPRPTEKAVTAPPVIPEAELKMERREMAPGEDCSYDFICTLVRNTGLRAEVSYYVCEDGTRRIAINGEDASLLIGHHGDTLDSLQYLANLASAQKNAKGERDKSRVTLDIEGYRAKREETLRALARRMAAKALRNNRNVTLEPMSAYERRIIHSEIQNMEGLTTNSIGSDASRRVMICLTDKKPVAKASAEQVAEAAEAKTEELAEQTVAAEAENNVSMLLTPEREETDRAEVVQEMAQETEETVAEEITDEPAADQSAEKAAEENSGEKTW